jgi:outer membrane lipoprotein-sorting protein
MRKLLSFFIAALCFALQPAFAQKDAKAKAVLDAVSNKVGAMKSFKANFSLNLTGGKGGKVNDSKKGTLALKGQKYHVTLSNQEIMCDGKTVWTYNKDAKEVQISNYNPSEQSMSPAKLFTPNFFEKEYTYAYKGERKEKGKNCDVVEMTPVDKSKQLSKIELLVDKSTSLIAGGNYWEKNGNKYNITVSNFTPNANIADTYFTWNPKEHGGVEAVDLR